MLLAKWVVVLVSYQLMSCERTACKNSLLIRKTFKALLSEFENLPPVSKLPSWSRSQRCRWPARERETVLCRSNQTWPNIMVESSIFPNTLFEYVYNPDCDISPCYCFKHLIFCIIVSSCSRVPHSGVINKALGKTSRNRWEILSCKEL